MVCLLFLLDFLFDSLCLRLAVVYHRGGGLRLGVELLCCALGCLGAFDQLVESRPVLDIGRLELVTLALHLLNARTHGVVLAEARARLHEAEIEAGRLDEQLNAHVVHEQLGVVLGEELLGLRELLDQLALVGQLDAHGVEARRQLVVCAAHGAQSGELGGVARHLRLVLLQLVAAQLQRRLGQVERRVGRLQLIELHVHVAELGTQRLDVRRTRGALLVEQLIAGDDLARLLVQLLVVSSELLVGGRELLVVRPVLVQHVDLGSQRVALHSQRGALALRRVQLAVERLELTLECRVHLGTIALLARQCRLARRVLALHVLLLRRQLVHLALVLGQTHLQVDALRLELGVRSLHLLHDVLTSHNY